MKKIVLLAALAAISACAKPAPTEEPTAAATDSMAAEPAVTTLAADGKPSTGKFQVTAADGSAITADVRPDGTYTVTDAGGTVTETGKWEQKSPEAYCVTPDTADAKQKCYEEKVDDKGVYTSKDPDTGEVSTVVRLEG
jgi:ABC-type Fe3+-hydroxamate transport system substrate-binding protein